MDTEGKGTGKLNKNDVDGMCTGPDKLREMKKAIGEIPQLENVVTVYVGDSNTDLPCLLHADVGIIIGDGASLLETCDRVGIKVNSGRSLRDIVREKQTTRKDGLMFYHFHDWRAIIESGLLE